jgi:hypothetical protein
MPTPALKACGGNGSAGFLFKSGGGEHCLTYSQFATLFGKRRTMPKKIGCGFFACVYQSPDPNKVVKITRDSSDPASLMLVQGSAAAPTLYRTFRLKNPDRWPGETWSVYAMVTEKLRPIIKSGVAATPREQEAERRIDRMFGCLREYDPNSCCRERKLRVGGVKGVAACMRLVKAVREIGTELRTHGMSHLPDVHSGNFGYDRQGRLKMLDFGVSGREPGKLRELAGARRRRR